MKEDERGRLGGISGCSLTNQAYQIIKEAIISLKLKPGERLKESKLAEELGISTTPIKGALTRLEQEGLATIEAVHRVKTELGVNLTLGASNVSFGLPDRDMLNSAFVTMVIAAGVTCLIVDVAKVRSIVLAADLILGKDEYAMRYIQAYRQHSRKDYITLGRSVAQ